MKKFVLFILLLLLTGLVACGGRNEPDTADSTPTTAADTPTAAVPDDTPLQQEAAVDSIEILILESFPVQVNVRARGDLPDGCTTIDNVETTQQGTTFNINITTLRQTGELCTEALVPFEETISLDVLGLSAGTYAVNVNGINGSFTLQVDNVAQAEEATPTPTATPVDSNMGIINGKVWHDLCAVAGGGGGDDTAVPSAGCIALPEGGFQANSLLEDGEPGIPNVLVSLGEGECPAVGSIATATTDEDGDYVFTDLPAGTYCVSIDPLDVANEQLLPGGFTFPDTEVNNASVTLTDGDLATGVNFGWDYQFLPVPEVDLANCTNSIAFVQETVPDDTVFGPGETFEKSWQLRNIGTCPWTTNYSLIFAGGDDLGGELSIPLESAVVPGQTVDIAIPLTAPETLGTYRADYLLADAAGNPFGVDGFADQVIWVQIEVGEPEATPEPSSAVIGGVVWQDVCFFTSSGEPSAGCVDISGDGSGFYRGDGELINEPRLADITVKLAAGACPADAIVPDSTVLATAVTDDAGLYRFEGLDEGLYCVAIEPFSSENVDLLIPGDWTWPNYGVGLQGINLAAGEERLEVDFGWEFQ
ncbi:NBR1-Ig-like domain-containing protein [Candidatus Leptofilum sp.]|uniref:NBR1-Ig-like domain-containing protein n=1 Tax=Candidatus Leptofilum sp. TaxID=3241576 RepID=UPI003B593CCA